MRVVWSSGEAFVFLWGMWCSFFLFVFFGFFFSFSSRVSRRPMGSKKKFKRDEGII